MNHGRQQDAEKSVGHGWSAFLFALLVSYAPKLETGLQAQDTHQRPTRSMHEKKHVHDHETIWSRMWRMLQALQLTDEDIQAIRADETTMRQASSQEVIRRGSAYRRLCLLFDAMYAEERTRTLLAFQRGEEFPITAADALFELQEAWIREGLIRCYTGFAIRISHFRRS